MPIFKQQQPPQIVEEKKEEKWGDDDFEFGDFEESKPTETKPEPKVKVDKMEMFSEWNMNDAPKQPEQSKAQIQKLKISLVILLHSMNKQNKKLNQLQTKQLIFIVVLHH